MVSNYRSNTETPNDSNDSFIQGILALYNDNLKDAFFCLGVGWLLIFITLIIKQSWCMYQGIDGNLFSLW